MRNATLSPLPLTISGAYDEATDRSTVSADRPPVLTPGDNNSSSPIRHQHLGRSAFTRQVQNQTEAFATGLTVALKSVADADSGDESGAETPTLASRSSAGIDTPVSGTLSGSDDGMNTPTASTMTVSSRMGAMTPTDSTMSEPVMTPSTLSAFSSSGMATPASGFSMPSMASGGQQVSINDIEKVFPFFDNLPPEGQFSIRKAQVDETLQGIQKDHGLHNKLTRLNASAAFEYAVAAFKSLEQAVELVKGGHNYDHAMRHAGFDFAISGQEFYNRKVWHTELFKDMNDEALCHNPDLKQLRDRLQDLHEIDVNSESPTERAALCCDLLKNLNGYLIGALGPESLTRTFKNPGEAYKTGRSHADSSRMFLDMEKFRSPGFFGYSKHEFNLRFPQ